jgi:multidrug transporter EmrE-like cation transporter
MRYVALFGTIAIMAVGQIVFKILALDAPETPWGFLTRPLFYGTLALYGGATILWLFALRAWPITVAYPSQALAIVLVTAAGLLWFGETLSGVQVAGLGAILGGLCLLALG